MPIYAVVLRLMHASSMVAPSNILSCVFGCGTPQFLIESRFSSFGVIVFAMGPVPPINFVIVEDYLFHSKFHFTGFDVNASFG